MSKKTHAYSVSAELASTTTQPATKSTLLTELSEYSGKSREEAASIRIQTAFQGYLARRAVRALRGLVRLKTLIEGPTGNRQTTSTLMYAKSFSCAMSNSRRIRMSEENSAFHRQLLQKQAKELEISQVGGDWNDSLQSKEQIEAKLLSKYEATMRQERAKAYSFSHQQQWKKSTRTTNLIFMDPTNPQWGWSWLERYMAGRPWETHGEKSQPSVEKNVNITGTEIAISYARRQFKRGSSRGTLGPGLDDDLRSVFSGRSGLHLLARFLLKRTVLY